MNAIATSTPSNELAAATNMNVLDDIIVFIPKLSFFGGQATLSADDLGIKSADLPADIVALGTKAIVNTDLLNYFKTTRKAIQRRAKEKGSAFLGGFAMSKDEAILFLKEVNPVLQELQEKVDHFLANYEDHVETWAAAHPQWYFKIKQSAPSLQTVKRRFEIKMPFIKVSPPSDDIGDSGMAEEISGLTGNVLQEIAAEVRVTWKDRGFGNQQIKGLLRRVSDKAKALSFIDSDLDKLPVLIESVIQSFPPVGKIEGLPYLGLKALMDMLQNPAETLKSLKAQQALSLEIEQDENQTAIDLTVDQADSTSAASAATASPTDLDDHGDIIVTVDTSSDVENTTLSTQPPVETQPVASWNW